MSTPRPRDSTRTCGGIHQMTRATLSLIADSRVSFARSSLSSTTRPPTISQSRHLRQPSLAIRTHAPASRPSPTSNASARHPLTRSGSASIRRWRPSSAATRGRDARAAASASRRTVGTRAPPPARRRTSSASSAGTATSRRCSRASSVASKRIGVAVVRGRPAACITVRWCSPSAER